MLHFGDRQGRRLRLQVTRPGQAPLTVWIAPDRPTFDLARVGTCEAHLEALQGRVVSETVRWTQPPPVELRVDAAGVAHRGEVRGLRKLQWVVTQDGEVRLKRGAENETTYDLSGHGECEVRLEAWVGDGYQPVSDTVRWAR